MAVDKTYYCCARTLNNVLAERVAKDLDMFINKSKYEEAIEYISSLSIGQDEKEKLVKCVESYKRSC